MFANKARLYDSVSTFIADVKTSIKQGLAFEKAVTHQYNQNQHKLNTDLFASLDVLLSNIANDSVDVEGCKILMQTAVKHYPNLITSGADVLKLLKGVESVQKREVIVDYFKDNEILMYQIAKTPEGYTSLRKLVPSHDQMNHIAERLYNRWETIYLACRVAQNTPRYKKSNAAIWIARENPQIQERLRAVINRAQDPKNPNGRTAKAWQLMDKQGDALAQHVYAYGYNRSSYGTGSVAVRVSKGYMYDGRVTTPETQVNMNNTSAHPRLHDATAMLRTLDDESSRPAANTSFIRIPDAPWPTNKQEEKTRLTVK